MAVDHSLTYKDRSVKNLPHRSRLKFIFKLLESVGNKNRYCDIGCSNGYITNLIVEEFDIRDANGLDHSEENIALAKQRYPNINFGLIDLNRINNPNDKYGFVSCFETLEHVGDLENALESLWNFVDVNGSLVVSVPIETGVIGLFKFLVKTLVFGYSLDELNKGKERNFFFKYLLSLVTNESVSIYRSNSDGYGTHFGFDLRLIDKWLKDRDIAFVSRRKMTTRFYIINKT
jgi:SAM-dependent methyltransferase